MPRGCAKLYEQPDCWVFFLQIKLTKLSHSEFLLTSLHISIYLFPCLSKQSFPIAQEGKHHFFNTDLLKQTPQWDSLLLAAVHMMYLQGRSSKQQQVSAAALL